jgi:hypothetical protein
MLSDVPGDVSMQYNATLFASNDKPIMAAVKGILEFHSERRFILICCLMKSIRKECWIQISNQATIEGVGTVIKAIQDTLPEKGKVNRYGTDAWK